MSPVTVRESDTIDNSVVAVVVRRNVHFLAINKQANDSTVRSPGCDDVSRCFCFVGELNSAFCKMFGNHHLCPFETTFYHTDFLRHFMVSKCDNDCA